MDHVVYDESVEGFQWFGFDGRDHQLHSVPRERAVKAYGASQVHLAEVLGRIPVADVRAYVAFQLGLSALFGSSTPKAWPDLHSPGIDAERYAKYKLACRILGIQQFATLPPNASAVVYASQTGDKEELIAQGQLGLPGGLAGDVPNEQYPLAKEQP
jgi:hypothetical protein